VAEYVHIEGLDGLLKRLQAFPVEMAKNGGPVRSALAKGGKIIRDQAKANVRAIVAEPNVEAKGREGFAIDHPSTGLLERSVILKRDRDPKKVGATERYQVRVKRGKSARGVSVTRYGKILEFGSRKIKAYAWLRNAAATRRGDFFRVVTDELGRGIARIEKKLGAKK
jgi:HK97 gp10 family phage protein